MNETSTQPQTQTLDSEATKPSQRTLDFIRQFARVYMAVPQMPGLVLN